VGSGEIPAGFIALVVSPIGDSLVSGAGSRRWSQVVSGCTYVCTGHLIDDPVVADKRLVVAVLVTGRRHCDLRRRGPVLAESAFTTIKWGLEAVFFGLTVVGLFSYVHMPNRSRVPTYIPQPAFTCCLACCGLRSIALCLASIREPS